MKAPEARYCAHCAMGHHTACVGDAPAFGGSCECADRAHDPEVRVAAAMRLYQRPDLSRSDHTVEELATQWRNTQ